MKRFFRKLLGGQPPPSSTAGEGPPLGSNDDPIRRMLFANQAMDELLSHVQLDGQPGPFQRIADASALRREGKREEAVAVLRGILDEKELETRLVLWVWGCLAELGVQPDGRAGGEVLGVVIEVPSGGGYDTLAAYVDGTARYLNFSGRAIFWDAGDEEIRALCQAFVDSTIPSANRAVLRELRDLPKGDITQVTLLTRSGIYVITNPPESVMGAGAALMIALIGRAEKEANGRR